MGAAVATLSGVVDPGQPGLPRGRNSLSAEVVRARQRERLMRGAIAAVGKKGYDVVTVADIVRAARVSRTAFYEHFTDKQDCVVGAATYGATQMIARVSRATSAETGGAPESLIARRAIRAYLELCASEPVFARVLFLEMPSVGEPARVLRTRAMAQLADLLRWAHRQARKRDPSLPAVPDWSYLAAVGAAYELIQQAVIDAGNGPADFSALEEPVVDVILRLLSVDQQ